MNMDGASAKDAKNASGIVLVCHIFAVRMTWALTNNTKMKTGFYFFKEAKFAIKITKFLDTNGYR